MNKIYIIYQQSFELGYENLAYLTNEQKAKDLCYFLRNKCINGSEYGYYSVELDKMPLWISFMGFPTNE